MFYMPFHFAHRWMSWYDMMTWHDLGMTWVWHDETSWHEYTWHAMTWVWHDTSWHEYDMTRHDMAITWRAMTWVRHDTPLHGGMTWHVMTWIWHDTPWHGYYMTRHDMDTTRHVMTWRGQLSRSWAYQQVFPRDQWHEARQRAGVRGAWVEEVGLVWEVRSCPASRGVGG